MDGQNLCAHFDQGETLQFAHWYLLPLLEWISSFWNPLLHEERLPNRNIGDSAVSSLNVTRCPPSLASDSEALAWEEEWYDWRERHAIRSARSGGLFPNVVFRRLRDAIEVSWDDEPLAGAGDTFRFTATGGSVILPPKLVAKSLFEVASQAAEHLLHARPDSARIQKLNASYAGLTDASQQDIRLGWMASLRIGWQAWHEVTTVELGELSRQAWQSIRQGLEQMNPVAARAALDVDEVGPLAVTGSCQAALLFGSVAPSISESDVLTLSRTLVDRFDESGAAYEELVNSSAEVPLIEHIPAWEQGYELAESLHDEYASGLGGHFVDVAGFVRRMGIEVTSIALDDTSIRACSLVGPQHKPTIVLNAHYPSGQRESVERFTLAHELCHLLYDRSRGQRLAIASGQWAPRSLEKRANAFAAMLLMPPHILRDAIADSPYPVTEREGVAFLCDRLKVNFTAVVGHLYNQTFMTEEDRDRLLGAARV
ncbi:ImmA/IrrE family metallo-endopeptidase [Streptomyces sp. NBC_00191]|uniref:ImmA/IrrE family metallo-endopeptidase n=1 Tax=Streptomyces sp. NBC_00191 TaxID=2975674 RepID=UPI0032478883